MRWLVAGGVAAAVQMIAFVTVAGHTRPGYDPNRNWISQLSLGPGGLLNDLNLALCGVWLVLCAIGLRRVTAARLILLCGVCLMALAVLRTDPGIGYPPGVTPVRTFVGTAHQLVSVVLGVAGTAAAALLGQAIGRRRTGLVVAAVMAVSFVAGSVLVLLDAGGVLPGAPSGLLERVALFAGFGWIGLVSATLATGPDRSPEGAATAAPATSSDLGSEFPAAS
ncbi:DUF998 domain-containing protein [Actinoplanes sp. NPDC051633]|uniref:DUF998 domain-containing protein n=1 Tax=Actinoplanes sp. NPDC051633 TaxID=3155670 RepID=UPI0034220371